MSQLDARTLGAAVQAHFDTHTLAKGRVYQRQLRVQNCLVSLAEPRGWLIAADVRGSQPTPYGVEIHLSGGDGTAAMRCPGNLGVLCTARVRIVATLGVGFGVGMRLGVSAEGWSSRF